MLVFGTRPEALDKGCFVLSGIDTKVVRIIQSYVGVVNKMVWRKF